MDVLTHSVARMLQPPLAAWMCVNSFRLQPHVITHVQFRHPHFPQVRIRARAALPPICSLLSPAMPLSVQQSHPSDPPHVMQPSTPSRSCTSLLRHADVKSKSASDHTRDHSVLLLHHKLLRQQPLSCLLHCVHARHSFKRAFECSAIPIFSLRH